jgi:sterol desaturase/sphingolipid hydroxylase (fatty acid hydroxylase superfamily)
VRHGVVIAAGRLQHPAALTRQNRFDDWLAPLAWVLEQLLQRPSTHRADHAELDDQGRVPHYNFARSLFIWDTLLGSVRFPRDSYPTRYGIPNDPQYPWYAQLWWPLLRSKKPDSENN